MAWVACLWVEHIGIAVERARLPHLDGEPFALAAADGTIRVASEEAARWGVRSGMAVQGARSLCGDLIVLPYDGPAYELAARPIWDILAVESSIVEPIKPEMAYMELRGTQSEITTRVRQIAETIAPRVGVLVRVGVGRTKFVARQAALGRQGEDGEAVVVPLGDEAAFLAKLPLALLPNAPKLDAKARQQIERLGVKTLGDIWTLPPHRLPKSLQKAGQQLLQWAQGHDASPVKSLWPPRTIAAEVRFEEGLEDRFFAENALLRLAEQIACQLSTNHEFCREITLNIGMEDHTWVQETERLAIAESQVPPIYRAALRLLQKLQIEQPVVSMEIVVGDIGSGSGLQLSLMDKAGELPHERMKRLEAVLNHLRKRYGPRAVIPAALLAKVRRIHLWIHPLGHLLCEPVDQVATDRRGVPVRYWKRNGRGTAGRISRSGNDHRKQYEVLAIHSRWRETGTRNGILMDAEVWRVETDPFGVSELRHLDTEWRITATWD